MSERRLSSLNLVTSTPVRRQTSVAVPLAFSDGSNTPSEEGLLEDLSKLSISEARTEDVPVSIRKVCRNTKDIQNFMPKNNTSLYHHVITNEMDSKPLAESWVAGYTRNPTEATCMMMQFVIDIAGFENISISKIITQENHSNTIQEFMHECPAELIDYTYLLNTNSKWSQNAINNISEFLEELVYVAYSTNEMFRRNIFNELLIFLKMLADSPLYPLKHTAVFIALKLCVAFGGILQKCDEQSALMDRDAQNTQDTVRIVKECKLNINTTLKLVNYSFKIVLSQCRIIEDELAVMQAACATELAKLFFLLTDHGRKTKILSFILDTSMYSDDYRRFSCIRALQRILKGPNCCQADTNIPKILSCLMVRISDESLDIACEAIFGMKIALQHYSLYVSPTHVDTLSGCLFSKYYIIGAAAGTFFYALLRGKSISSNELFTEIAKLQVIIANQYSDLLPLYVESLIEACDEFHHPEMLINFILNYEIPLEQEVALVKILAHSVSQILTGKSSIERIGSRKGKCGNDVIVSIVDEVIPKLRLLLEKYKNETRSLDALLFMMCNFTYDDSSMLQHRGDMKLIFNTFIEIFHKAISETSLLKISEILSKCIEEINPLKMYAQSTTRILIDDSLVVYENFVNSTSWDKGNWRLLEINLMKLNALMQFHDMPINWNIDFFKELIGDNITDYKTVLSSVLKCGNSYVLMNVQTFLEEYESEIPQGDRRHTQQALITIITKHLNVCFEYLISHNTVLRIEAFRMICNLCTEMKKFSDGKDLNTIAPKLSDGQKNALIEFLRVNVFRKSADPEHCGWMLKAMIDTIIIGGFPRTILTNILSYCNMYYYKYADYYRLLIQMLAKDSPYVAAVLITTTLKDEYENLQSGNAVACANFSDLKKLSMQLQNITPKSVWYLVLYNALHYSSRSPSHLKFLYYVQCFCKNIDQVHRKLIIDKVEEIFTEESRANQHVRDFVAKIQEDH